MRTRFSKTGCLLPVLLLLVAVSVPAQESPSTRQLKVGLVLSGGGARGIAHIGVLRWCEEHRIPIDYISGTSMGGLIGGLYATGMKPDEILRFFHGIDWKEVFDVGPSFNQLAYRRREDRRSFQTRFEFGLKDGLSLPNGLSSAHYIGLLIDRFTLPYSTLESFDDLPIPFRCMATDFLKAEPVELRDGPLGSALRATMAIPGVFPPVEREGRILVDGGLLNNIPTNVMRAELKPDVVIAVDNGTQLGDARTISSLVGVLGQSVTVMTIDNDRRNLRLADVIIAPELGDLGTLDFERIDATAEIGYRAASAKAAILEKFSLDAAAWEVHLARRRARERTNVPVPTDIKVAGVRDAAQAKIVDELKGYVGPPLDVKSLERDLTRVIGEGRYQSLGYGFLPAQTRDRNTLLIRVVEKGYAPPTINLGIEIDGSDVNDVNFTIGSRLTFFDVGGYGSEWRTDVKVGFRSLFQTEFFRPLNDHGLFVAPRGFYRRERQDLFVGTDRVAQYQGSEVGAGLDVGYLARRSELRVGYEIARQDAGLRVGLPVVSTLDGSVSLARVRWAFDGQNSATVPTRGVKVTMEGRWFFAAPGAQRDFLQGEVRGSSFTPVTESGSVFVAAAIGTTFNRDAAFFQQFTLGGPFNLGAYNRNEFRGNHYALGALGYLHRIGELPPLIGGRISAIGWYDVGNAFNDFGNTQLRNGATIGVILDTKLGPVSLIGSFAEGGRGKVYFAFGKFF